jgi:hypothetical protein
MKNCPICKNDFIPHKNVQKYCSKKCFKKFRKIYMKNYSKNYYIKNIKELKKIMKEYYLQNKNKILKQVKSYYIKHRTKITKYINDYNKNRKKIDINFKILCNLRRRLNHALKGKSKSISTLKLIGCSIYKLKKYLEKQFKIGMSWDNYGKWHIDHIKPCILFDLSKSSEQRKCFNYKNLQPLWAEENLSKGKKSE